MIRIKPGRCGYGGEKGYTCQRLPQLQEWMFNESNAFVSQMTAEFDKLPLRVKGMVFTEETIDMGWSEFGPHPEVPELSCRSNTDPASDATDVSVWGSTGIPVEVGNATAYPVYGGTSGWLDLFNSGYEITGGTQYFYHNISGTTAATSDVYIKVTGVEHEYHDIYLVSNIPTFRNGEQEMEMGPGLLEPMLDTDFAPVGIDTIPAWEAGLDADIFTNIVLNAWKGVIDDRIRNIYWRLNNMPIPSGIDENLLDLLDDDYSSTDCTNFRITLVDGASLQKVGETPVTNTYAVSGGNIYINDEYIEVAGIALVQSVVPFKVWLQIYKLSEPDPETGNTWAALLSTGPSVPTDPGRYAIGGVEVVQASTSTGAYILYKVFQEDCLSNIAVDEDAQTGLHGVIQSGTEGGETIVSIPGSTLEPAAGILQPAVNIWLNDPRSESTEDVPTVEAVYNFIHGITAYNGPVADAKATEKSVSNTEGSTVYSQVTAGSVITITKDRADQNTQETLYNLQTADTQLQAAQADYSTASTNYNTAKSNYDSAKAAWEEAGSPSSGAEYNAYQAAQTALSTAETALDTATTILATKQTAYDTAYGNVYGAVTAGTPGTVYTIDGIVISDSSILGGSSSVPTAYGVWTFVHDIYALATVGSVNTSVTPHTHSQGTPGTVFTIDVLDKEIYDAGKYLQDEVPTVKAVMDYVQNEQTVDAIPGSLIDGSTTEEWYDTTPVVTPVTGIVDVSQTIVVGSTPGISLYAVPSVKSVYDFIHGTTVDAHYRALATAGQLGEIQGTIGSGASAQTVITGYTPGGTPGTTFLATAIPYGSTVAIGLDDCAPTLDAVIGYVSTFVSGYTATGGTISAPEDTEESWVSGHAGTAGIVTLSNNVIMASDPSNRSLSPYTVPTVEAVVLYVSAYLSGTTAGHLVYGDPAETIADAIVGRATVAGNIYLNTDPEYRDASKQAVPTVEAVYNFIKGGTVYGKQGWVYSDAHATAGTIAASETQGSAHIVTGVTASGCIPGTCDIVSNIVGATNTTTGAVFSVTNVVPTADAVVQYVNATLKPVAVNGLIQIVTGGTEQLWETDPPAAAGIVQPVTNILVGSAVNHAESSKDVPTVLAVYEFVHNYDTSTIASPLAVPVDMHTIGNAATVGITASGSTPGTFFVTGNMEVVAGATAFPAPAVVPTAEAVAKYVELHGGTGGDGILPNYQGLQVLSGVGSGTNGIGIGYLLPVSPDEKTWFEVDPNLGYDAVFATENDTTGTAMSAGMANAVSSSVAGYIRLCIIDPGQNQTAGCVRLYTENATRGVPLYKSNGFALPASGNSIISVSSNNESVSGDPGRVYISNGVNFGGDRAYSKITAPSVEAVYDFIHGTTASGVQMLSSLADIAGSTITGTTALALVDTAKPGTVYVTDDFTLLGGTVTTYNNPQAVPTALAVHNYIAGLNLDSPAVPGTLEATSSSEAWDENDTAVLGTVLVSKNVTVSTTGNTISTVAVPTVAAVHTFVSGYTASPGTLTINGSAGTNTVEGGSFGIVITTDNVQVNASSGTDDADYAVPTVQAVYDFMHETDTSAGIRALATGGTITAPVSGVSASLESTATPGTCYIATDMTGMSGTNVVLDSPVSVVPSVNAVKQYVDSHGGGYNGPFAVEATGTGTNVKIASGKAYFGSGDPFVYAGVASRAMANGTTLFLVCTKGNTNATIATTNTTGATVACFPIASKDASGNITQRQWGDINIMGRWM